MGNDSGAKMKQINTKKKLTPRSKETQHTKLHKQ
jgi:hypothetical protein